MLDKRADALTKAARADPDAAIRSYKSAGTSSKRAYLRSNLLYSMGRAGEHKAFIQLAIDEFNSGDHWLPALATVLRLFPDLSKQHSELPDLHVIAANPMRELLPTKLKIDLSELEWKADQRTFVHR
ncbi:MAG: hypothetical protein IT461_01845 [Planctomycetes bacterium]|nr:hypothetical protein [Planctomycetota bacterium]